MTKFVRVKLENGALATVSDVVAKAAELKPLDPEKYPAVDRKGRPLPPEFPDPADEGPADVSGSNSGDNRGSTPPPIGGKPDIIPPAGS